MYVICLVATQDITEYFHNHKIDTRIYSSLS